MTTEEFLVKLGVDPSHVGFDYIVDAVSLLAIEPHAAMMWVYGEVARAHGTTASCVERAIRYAVLTTLDRYGAEHCGRLLGQLPDLQGGYTNSRFLALVTRKTARH